MEKEKSDDSYCTTDDGVNSKKPEEDMDPEELTEKEGDIVKLKEDHIFKIIKKVGQCSYKPYDTDNAMIQSSAHYIDIDTKETKEVPLLCKLSENEEINLSDPNIPKSFALGVSSMRVGEEAEIHIKFSYIFRFLNNSKQIFEENLKLFYDPEFQKKYENEKLICNVKLIRFYVMQNLMDKGEIRKKIVKKSNIKIHKYAKNSDIVTYNLKCIYKDKEIYNKENVTTELDIALSQKELSEIEHRILENVREGEYSVINVNPSYMTYRNKDFLEKYNIDNTEPTIFICEIIKIDEYDYVYNVSKDSITKCKTLYPGIGVDNPDREMLVKMKLQIKVNGEIKFNTFECDNIEQYINEKKYFEEYQKFRNEMNIKYHIENFDDEIDYNKNAEIYKECNFNNLLDIDLKLYTMPNYMRKVLVHMKRNQLLYLKTSYIDYFIQDKTELSNIGKPKEKKDSALVEIYIHLYEFMQTQSFSKYSYEDKLSMMSKYKQIADDCFKSGRIFRAMKIYHNLDYRFDEGDIFGNEKKKAEEYLKDNKPKIYEELIKMRINVHNNYALTKIKLGKTLTAYETLKKVLSEFDSNNTKALYLYGKCCIDLYKYQEAVSTLSKLNSIQPNDVNIKTLLQQAEDLNNKDLNKEKKMFKKMFKYSE